MSSLTDHVEQRSIREKELILGFNLQTLFASGAIASSRAHMGVLQDPRRLHNDSLRTITMVAAVQELASLEKAPTEKRTNKLSGELIDLSSEISPRFALKQAGRMRCSSRRALTWH